MSWTPPSWDADPEVLSPVGRPLAEQIADGPRRQALDGFDPVYRDIVDYIIRCTHRIWEEKNIGLCRTHYGADCHLHTLGGPAIGVETVVQNTIGALAIYSDRVVLGEDVIWSEDAPRTFYSSHRIISRATQMGDEAGVGAATLLPSGARTIADCLVRENRIVEEWLVRDTCVALWLVGADPRAVAAAQAEADRVGDPARHAWRAAAMATTRDVASVAIAAGHPAAVPAHMLDLALGHDLYGEAAALLSPVVEVRWPANRHGFGRGFWTGCLTQLRAVLHDVRWRLDHIAARPLPHGEVAVALRWSLTGRHGGSGVWGPASGRDLYLMAVSHYRLRDGVIVADITVFDECAVLRQIVGGLGA